MTPDYDRAACRGANTDLFFDQQTIMQAQAICDTCEIQGACILDNLNEKIGVFGCSERARRRVRRAIRKNRERGIVLGHEAIVGIARSEPGSVWRHRLEAGRVNGSTGTVDLRALDRVVGR
ncbi:MAG: WhiB family transcriptional regulator [Microthrixaceae bacterium]